MVLSYVVLRTERVRWMKVIGYLFKVILYRLFPLKSLSLSLTLTLSLSLSLSLPLPLLLLVLYNSGICYNPDKGDILSTTLQVTTTL